MVIARFYIKDGVQGVGYRPFILEQIFNFDLNGAPKNLLDGRVEVVVEGRKEDIEDFYEYLKAKLPPVARNPGASEIEFGDFHVVDRRDVALALNLNQWNTAIPVVIEINKNVMGLGKEMSGLGMGMREGFERMGTEMHEGFAEMREEFKHMNQTLETLPERIARAFKDMK
ncbi:MAG: acylphosphatase [Methanosarcinales archaeon]|nr:acylphosphatase [Methanosarcinales archaeon]